MGVGAQALRSTFTAFPGAFFIFHECFEVLLYVFTPRKLIDFVLVYFIFCITLRNSSGTSTVAQWLKSLHLPVGYSLLGPAQSTPFQNQLILLWTDGTTPPRLPKPRPESCTHQWKLWPTKGVSQFPSFRPLPDLDLTHVSGCLALTRHGLPHPSQLLYELMWPSLPHTFF